MDKPSGRQHYSYKAYLCMNAGYLMHETSEFLVASLEQQIEQKRGEVTDHEYNDDQGV